MRHLLATAAEMSPPSPPPQDSPASEPRAGTPGDAVPDSPTHAASLAGAAAGSRRRRRAGDVALVLLLGWAGGAFLFEAQGARHDWLLGKLHQPTSAYWRVGSAPPERLRRCLAGVDAVLAPGAPVVLWDPGADFYRWRWAAYFLPQREVVQSGAATTAGQLVVVAAGAGGAPAGASRVHGSRWCGLYRLP